MEREKKQIKKEIKQETGKGHTRRYTERVSPRRRCWVLYRNRLCLLPPPVSLSVVALVSYPRPDYCDISPAQCQAIINLQRCELLLAMLVREG